MSVFLIITGIILIATARIKRFYRVAKYKQKLFNGFTTDETIIQWSGWISLILGFVISM